MKREKMIDISRDVWISESAICKCDFKLWYCIKTARGMADPRVRSKSRRERVEQSSGSVIRQWEEKWVQCRTSPKENEI